MTIAEASLQIEGLKEIMFVNCEIEKDLFMSMSNDEIREFVDEKLLEESVRVFLLDEENLNFPSEENINISAAFTDDYQNPPVEEDKIRLIFWEELDETRATIDLNNCDIDFDDSLKIELGIKSNLMFYEIQDYVDEYVFSDLDCKILVNGEEIDNYIESESFGMTINKKLIISSGKNITEDIDVEDEDELISAVEDFKAEI
jgi:hypothetical protein